MSRAFASLVILVLFSVAFQFVPLSESRRVQAIIDQKRHVRIAFLDLRHNEINSLEDLEFPGSLDKLDLSHNRINSIKGIKFPARLKSLDLSHNLISSIKGIQLPAGLTSLDLVGNPISIIEGFVFPAELTSLRLDEKLKPFIPRALLQRVNRGTLNIVYNGATRPQKKSGSRFDDFTFSFS